ncbi:MAG: DUF1015 domain-containing protein [Actinomycetia bacterium]|nr:DUF1015 domain-containing protein [Actinomycetes bacterium]
MPRFEPFRALRYASGTSLEAVLAPPYDVLSADDARALAAQDPHNVVHVDVPLVVHASARDPYEAAAAVLRRWVAIGVLVRDADPAFTIHRMRFVDDTGTPRETVGVLGALEVVDEGAGGVLPHERTTPKASTDRLDLTRATRANLSPVWGLALVRGLTDALADPGEPVGTATLDGVTHLVERLTDADRVAAVSALVGSDDVLVADGHHRYAVARAFRDEVRAGPDGGPAAGAEVTLAYVGELTADQLAIAAIHRVYRGIGFPALRSALARSFVLSPAPQPAPGLVAEMVDRGALVLLGPGGSSEWLTPRPGAFPDVRALDGAYLEHALVGTTVEVGYQHGVLDAAHAVASGAVTAAVLIRPTSVAEVLRTAREGLLMPPKSTFFTPKPPTGLVIREIG